MELFCIYCIWGIEYKCSYFYGCPFKEEMYCIHLCRIDHAGVIKVADFGLTEDMYGSDYFRHRPGKDEAEDEEKMPIY